MKKSKFLALLMLLAVFVSCFGNGIVAKADDFVVIVGGKTPVYTIDPGETQHISIPVKLGNYNYGIQDSASISVIVEADDNKKIFDTIEARLTRDNISQDSLVGLSAYYETNVEFDLTLKDTVKIGDYTANIKFSFTGYDYGNGDMTPVNSSSFPFQIRVRKEKVPAQLTVASFSYDENLAAVGSTFDLKFDVKNEGEIAALNTYVSVKYPEGIIPAYTMESIKVGDLKAGEKKSMTLPVRVLPNAEDGLKEITIEYTYKDADGSIPAESPTQRKAYLTIQPASASATEDAKLVVRAVKLNPEVETDSTYNLEIEVENIGVKPAGSIIITIPEDGGVGTASGILPMYDTAGIRIASLNPGKKQVVTLPLSITKNVSSGLKDITVQAVYKNSNGESMPSEKVNAFLTIPEKKQEEEAKNSVVISDVVQSPEQPVPGDILTLTFTVTNNGNRDITDLALYGANFSNGFEPLTADGREEVGNLGQGESREVSMQIRLGEDVREKMKELALKADYVDTKGDSQKGLDAATIYIRNIQLTTEEQLKNSIVIGNISQSPAAPVVGERVTITFTVSNNGTKEVSDLKFAGRNLGKANFEPVSSEVYTNVGTIPAGGSRNVSMSFKVGEDIPEGFNELALRYSYTDGNGDFQSDDTAVYILNVKNESSLNNSKPKLIVSDFSVDSEELRAGTTFNFTFMLKNTHAIKAAKNIKVTITQAENIFSATQGSNSFYIDSIGPGKIAESTINLKVKSDVATGAYEIKIGVEYEYDDMSEVDAREGGVKDENTIKLQAVENARPAVQNLSVGYGWDTPTVNQATSLMFDFYNMGKSTLSNVYVTLSGDFQFESGTMQIIGSVGAGSREYQEISIIPTMEGMATGILTVHFEDSNGDEVTKDFELPSTYVQGEPDYSWNPGIYEPSGDDYPMGGDDLTVAKEPIMPVWTYALCLVAALVVGTFLTRLIIIKVYKRKLINAEEV